MGDIILVGVGVPRRWRCREQQNNKSDFLDQRAVEKYESSTDFRWFGEQFQGTRLSILFTAGWDEIIKIWNVQFLPILQFIK